MAPSALEPPHLSESPTVSVGPVPSLLAPTTKYNDWRADLQTNGFTVVKNAIPQERAIEYQQRAFEWLKSFGNDELDLSNPETWVNKNLPQQSKINTFNTYGVAHEKFMWDARMEPGVLGTFAKLWGTEELLASFDSLNITLPNRKDVPELGAWEHVDQSPFRRGVHCVQGIINLSKAGPDDGGLMVYPGSHLLHDEFLDTQTDKTTWMKRDFYKFEKDQLAWFKNRGMQPHKVCAEAGDLILWDSRTIHYGAEPSPCSNTIRTVIYACYAPARLATPKILDIKQQMFKKYGATTHWPCDNIQLRPTETILDDGTRDPRDRDRPRELPEMSEKLLKLAGVMAY